MDCEKQLEAVGWIKSQDKSLIRKFPFTWSKSSVFSCTTSSWSLFCQLKKNRFIPLFPNIFGCRVFSTFQLSLLLTRWRRHMVSIGNFTESMELLSYNQYYVNTAQCTEASFTIAWESREWPQNEPTLSPNHNFIQASKLKWQNVPQQ